MLDTVHVDDRSRRCDLPLLFAQPWPTPAAYGFARINARLWFCQFSRLSLASARQPKPQILTKAFSKPRTQFLFVCLQIWSGLPGPSATGWGSCFSNHVPRHNHCTAAIALCHKAGKLFLHRTECSRTFCSSEPVDRRLRSLFFLPPKTQRMPPVFLHRKELLRIHRFVPAARAPFRTPASTEV